MLLLLHSLLWSDPVLLGNLVQPLYLSELFATTVPPKRPAHWQSPPLPLTDGDVELA